MGAYALVNRSSRPLCDANIGNCSTAAQGVSAPSTSVHRIFDASTRQAFLSLTRNEASFVPTIAIEPCPAIGKNWMNWLKKSRARRYQINDESPAKRLAVEITLQMQDWWSLFPVVWIPRNIEAIRFGLCQNTDKLDLRKYHQVTMPGAAVNYYDRTYNMEKLLSSADGFIRSLGVMPGVKIADSGRSCINALTISRHDRCVIRQLQKTARRGKSGLNSASRI